MNTRQAVQETIKFLFKHLEERGYDYTKEQIEKAALDMHDNDVFLDEMIDFMQDHLETFGDNYGL